MISLINTFGELMLFSTVMSNNPQKGKSYWIQLIPSLNHRLDQEEIQSSRSKISTPMGLNLQTPLETSKAFGLKCKGRQGCHQWSDRNQYPVCKGASVAAAEHGGGQ